MGPESKLHKKLVRATPKIVWNRIENLSNVGTVIVKESFMRLQIILLVTVTVIVIMTSSCTRDFNLNPWTTAIRVINDS